MIALLKCVTNEPMNSTSESCDRRRSRDDVSHQVADVVTLTTGNHGVPDNGDLEGLTENEKKAQNNGSIRLQSELSLSIAAWRCCRCEVNQ